MFTDLLRNLRIYSRLLALHLRTALEYEADFWIGIVGMGLTHVTGFVFVWTFFQNVPVVAGWRRGALVRTSRGEDHGGGDEGD